MCNVQCAMCDVQWGCVMGMHHDADDDGALVCNETEAGKCFCCVTKVMVEPSTANESWWKCGISVLG